jgi:hypothetical protein
MQYLADVGDDDRLDIGCGVLFGTIRDMSFKLRQLAYGEIDEHRSLGLWNLSEEKSLKDLKKSDRRLSDKKVK